jgi:formylglycine-generating enzyme required for sulfatase activity
LPGQENGNRGALVALTGFIILAVALIVAALLFRIPLQERFAADSPPPISETAVYQTTEARAVAIIASTPSATATAVPTETPTAQPTHTDTPTITATAAPTETPTITPSPTSARPPASYTRQEDDMPMDYIPGGTFLMGSPDEDFTAAPD